MKKIIIISIAIFIIIAITLLILFNSKKYITNEYVEFQNNLVFEYAKNYKLIDYIKIDGELLDKDEKINTYTLKNNKQFFEYIHNEKIYTGFIEFKVEDITPPLILNSSSYTIIKNEEMNLEETIFCADDYDKKPDCIITGEYDMTKTGIYPLTLTATDSSNNKTIKKFNLYVIEKPKTNSSDNNTETNLIKLESIINDHKTDKTRIGIDVSSWQKEIDWVKVKASGIEFAILRIGFGWDDEHTLDNRFIEYLKGAKEVGLDIGIYYYSYASSVEEAIDAADWVIKTLDNEELQLPIAFDWEEWSNWNAYEISLVELNQMADAFIKVVEEAGYIGANYGSSYYLNNIWKYSNHLTWLAHYTNKTNHTGEYYMWQLTNIGEVDGIIGGVDINVLY